MILSLDYKFVENSTYSRGRRHEHEWISSIFWPYQFHQIHPIVSLQYKTCFFSTMQLFAAQLRDVPLSLAVHKTAALSHLDVHLCKKWRKKCLGWCVQITWIILELFLTWFCSREQIQKLTQELYSLVTYLMFTRCAEWRSQTLWTVSKIARIEKKRSFSMWTAQMKRITPNQSIILLNKYCFIMVQTKLGPCDPIV